MDEAIRALADAYAIATAKALNAKPLVGQDAEFKGVDVSVERLTLT